MSRALHGPPPDRAEGPRRAALGWAHREERYELVRKNRSAFITGTD